MATFSELQAVQDLVKQTNIANDQLDCASYILRGRHPETGEILDFDLSKTIEQAKRTIRAALTRAIAIELFLEKVDPTSIDDAVKNYGGNSLVEVQGFVSDMTSVSQEVLKLIDSAKDSNDLIVLAEIIEAKIPKLLLIRRIWDM